MTPLAKALYEKLKSMPTVEQDAVVSRMLQTIEEKERWKRDHKPTGMSLNELIAETQADIANGRTRPLDELLDELGNAPKISSPSHRTA